jgi:hypothetical protein
MSRIEPSRLSQILHSLVAPQNKAEANKRNDLSEAKPGKARRDISVLRSTLKSRLRGLRQTSADFDSAAPIVLVQEILRWEFGSEIADHNAFEKATAAISEALKSAPEAQGSLKRLIDRLSEDAR